MAGNMGNVMRRIELDKVTVNIGCGGDEDDIERAINLIRMLTNDKTPVVTLSKTRSTFGVSTGNPVGVKLTLRGQDAMDFLKLSFGGVDEINESQFDDEGNFSFGVKEYIELPGIKYQHDIGMFGFDVAVTLKRPGFRISKRKIQRRKIPGRHKITSGESMAWVKDNFDNIEITG